MRNAPGRFRLRAHGVELKSNEEELRKVYFENREPKKIGQDLRKDIELD